MSLKAAGDEMKYAMELHAYSIVCDNKNKTLLLGLARCLKGDLHISFTGGHRGQFWPANDKTVTITTSAVL